MVVKEVKVLNKLGFHARVASRITRSVNEFQSSVAVRKDGRRYDLKSVTGVMLANAKQGDILTIESEGPDEETAAEMLTALFADKFGES